MTNGLKSKLTRNFKRILIIGVVILIGIQFIPMDRSNPSVVMEPNWDSPATRALAKRACFDCHSNLTNWPWYAYVAPVSWLVVDHVHEARAELNMTDWKPGDGKDAAKEVRKGKMPLKQYLWLHSEARLTEAEKQAFIAGLVATFGEEGEDQREKDPEHKPTEPRQEKTKDDHR